MNRKMDPGIKKRWVEALRSGEYEQGRNALVDEKRRYCCLGVLTDLAVKDGFCSWSDSKPDWTRPILRSEEGLPRHDVIDWASLPDDNPQVIIAGDFSDRRTLAELNDAGKPFSEIADLIEEQL